MANMAYLKLEGQNQGNFEGSCDQKGHEKLIEVYAVDHSIIIPKDPQTGQPTGARIHQPFTITKPLDKASPKIMQAIAAGERMKTFELEYVTINEKGQLSKYYKIQLTNAVIVSRETCKKNIKLLEFKDLTDYEVVSFTYEKIVETFTPDGVEGEDNWKEPFSS